MRNVSKNSLTEAMEASVFFRVVHSVSDIDNLRSDDTSMLYHRSCYKMYTSRRNCGFFKGSKGSVCCEQNLSCTDLCPCQALDLCHNVITHRTDIEDDDA